MITLKAWKKYEFEREPSSRQCHRKLAPFGQVIAQENIGFFPQTKENAKSSNKFCPYDLDHVSSNH